MASNESNRVCYRPGIWEMFNASKNAKTYLLRTEIGEASDAENLSAGLSLVSTSYSINITDFRLASIFTIALNIRLFQRITQPKATYHHRCRMYCLEPIWCTLSHPNWWSKSFWSCRQCSKYPPTGRCGQCACRSCWRCPRSTCSSWRHPLPHQQVGP